MRRFFFGLAVFALAAPMPLLAETTDRQIAQQIVQHLKSQKEAGELKGFNLDLQVEDGAVFLKGFVSEREQRRKAVEAARKVEGVTQVFNEIEIKSVDEKPIEQPLTKLASQKLETPPEPPEVSIETVNEEATQIGGQLEEPVVTQAVAPQPIETARAIEATQPAESSVPTNVFRAPKPIQVPQNPQLEPAAAAPSARQITQQIIGQYRHAMKQGELQGFGIDVSVEQGIVTLAGTVSDAAQREFAIDVARHTQGVVKVVDALDVTGAASTQLASHDGADGGVQHAFRNDSSRGNDAEAERIAKQVVDGLQRQKQEGLLSNFGIDVQVDGRIVWMSGYVKDTEQHTRALNVARYVPGVEKVVNDLKIGQNQTLRPVNATLPQEVPAQPAPGQQQLNYRMVPVQYVPVQALRPVNQTPMAFAPARPVNHTMQPGGQPVPMTGNGGVGIAPARFDHPQMPGYAWPSYAPHPNYGAVTYPKQYSPSAWPYIGPFYPYPQVPLGWRRATLEWDDGWWTLKLKNTRMH